MSWEGRDMPRDEDFDDGVIPRTEVEEHWFQAFKDQPVPMELANAIIAAPLVRKKHIDAYRRGMCIARHETTARSLSR